MGYYRESFPTFTVIPKMHVGRLGFGMMGKQEAESIHAFFNRLGKMFDVIPDWLQQLKCEMKKYLLHLAPAAKPIK